MANAFDLFTGRNQQTNAAAMDEIDINTPVAAPSTLRQMPSLKGRLFSAGMGTLLLAAFLIALAAAVGNLTGISLFRSAENIVEEVAA